MKRALLVMLLFCQGLLLPAQAQESPATGTGRLTAWLSERLTAALVAFADAHRPPPVLEDALPDPDLRLLITGNTGGISSRHSRVELDRATTHALVDAGQALRTGYAGQGAVTDGRNLLFTPEGFGSTALTRFLESPPFTREVLNPDFPALDTNMGLVFELKPEAPRLSDLETAFGEGWPNILFTRITLRQVRWTNAAGDTVLGLERKGGLSNVAQLSPQAPAWALRFITVRHLTDGANDTPHRVVTLLNTWAEGSRRVGLVQEQTRLARERHLDTLVLDAGNALDGFSYLAGATLSLHRPNDWSALADSGCTILSPALNELLVTPERLREEASAHAISLVSANILNSEGQHAFDPFLLVERGGHRILVTGVTDPGITASVPSPVAQAIRVADPEESLRDLSEAIRKASPDVVVLLSVLPPETLAAVTSDLEGIDLVLGDFHRRHYNEDEQLVFSTRKHATRYHDRRHEPLFLHTGWGGQVAELDLSFDEDSLDLVRARSLTVTPWRAAVPKWVEAVMDVRHRVYVDHEGIVLPDISQLIESQPRLRASLTTVSPFSQAKSEEALLALLDLLPARLTPELWQHLIANLLRNRLDADIALLRPLPWRHLDDGPLRQLDAMSLLALPDKVQLYSIDGKDLNKLLFALSSNPEVDPVTSGYSAAKKRIGGRPIEEARTYTLVTTNELALRAPFNKLLGAAELEERFVVEDWNITPNADSGEPLTLKQVVLAGLDLLRPRSFGPDTRQQAWITEHPDYAQRIVSLLEPQGATLEPEWTLWIRDISVAFSQYSNVAERTGYEAVRETRVNTPDNFSFSVAGDISLIYEDPAIAWETRATTVFGEIQFDDEDKEIADDIVVSSELRLNLFNLLGEASEIKVVPFFNGRFDTEYTQLADARERQKELRGTLGLTSRISSEVRDIRFGFLAEVDFVRKARPFEGGLELAADFDVPLPARMRFQSTLSFRYYFPLKGDNEEDLGLILAVTANLAIPVFKRFALDLFADAFLFQGKVDATSSVGTSLIFGVNLSYDRIFAF